jgi:hypothetical protein
MPNLPPKTWWIIGGGLLAGLAIGSLIRGGRRVRVSQELTSGYPPVGGVWVDPGAADRIRYYADKIAAITNWGPMLGEYLTTVAYWESRGNPQACFGSCNENSARGWFQMRKPSGCFDDSGMSVSEILNDEAAQVALAACHINRLGHTPWADSGQKVQTRDIRRGWKFPKWASDDYRNDPETYPNRDNYMATLDLMGFGSGFASEPMFPTGYYWPGLDAALEAVRA